MLMSCSSKFSNTTPTEPSPLVVSDEYVQKHWGSNGRHVYQKWRSWQLRNTTKHCMKSQLTNINKDTEIKWDVTWANGNPVLKLRVNSNMWNNLIDSSVGERRVFLIAMWHDCQTKAGWCNSLSEIGMNRTNEHDLAFVSRWWDVGGPRMVPEGVMKQWFFLKH